MTLKPYVLPYLVELNYEEFDLFRVGQKVSGAFLSSGEIPDFMRGQPLFCLEKSGAKEGSPIGCYRVLFDVVSERVCRFQTVGSEAAERGIEVV